MGVSCLTQSSGRPRQDGLQSVRGRADTDRYRVRATVSERFFTTGGTLSHDAPSYVERRADEALAEGLLGGHYCYILTSRQMGKSSLMIRTAAKLRELEDSRVAVLDLAAVGQNLTPEQWYDGLLLRLGRQLGLEDEFDDFWLDNERLGPVQRFFEAIFQVYLLRNKERLTLFVDELDTVRSLPFSSDEFFAAIRQCFNARLEHEAWHRLTFCLLGVATPSDLIQDPHISPFNIGRRIVLEDFRWEEAVNLEKGLAAGPHGKTLLERIFAWTNGHPYLTQRLCKAVSDQNRDDSTPLLKEASAVDGLCDRLFLGNRAKERDDNLVFVRERLLRSDHDRSAVLDTYRKVRSGTPVADDETNPLVGALHLAGVTRVEAGNLRVRNRIYRHVFDIRWVRAMMPDAEMRRQKEAYRRGAIRATALAFIVVAAMLYLAVTAFDQSQQARARLMAQNTTNGSRLLEAREDFDALTWFSENLKLTRDSSVADQLGRERFAAVLRTTPKLTHLLPHEAGVRHATFSPDGTLLLTGSDDQNARVWDLRQGELKYPAVAHPGRILHAAFSPDGTRFVTASSDQAARIYDTATGNSVGALLRHDYEVRQAVFSPDGSMVATASLDDSARVWDVATGQPLTAPLQHRYAVTSVMFSPDAKWVVTASEDGTARLWEIATERTDPEFEMKHDEPVVSSLFSSDGEYIATAAKDGFLKIWRPNEPSEPPYTVHHPGEVTALGFDPSGTLVATGCSDGLVRFFDVRKQQLIRVPLVHRDRLQTVSISPDGAAILTVTIGNEARVWDGRTGEAIAPPFRHLDHIHHAEFDASGRRVVTAGADHLVKVWDLAGDQGWETEWQASAPVQTVTYSPDGSRFAYGTDAGQITVRSSATGEPVLETALEHGAEVRHLTFSPDGQTLVSSGLRGKTKLWNLENGTVRHTLEHGDTANLATFNRTGTRLITASRDRTARLWNPSTGESVLSGSLEHTFQVVNAGFGARGRELVTAGANNSVSVWNALTGKRVRGPFQTGYSIGRPALDPAGGRFAALVSANEAQVFSLSDGKSSSAKMRHRAVINYVSFDHRGEQVVTTSDDYTARVWSARTGLPISPPLRHQGPVTYAQFSEDNHQVLTVGADQEVRLWSVRNGAPLAPKMSHDMPVVIASMDPESEALLTVSGNRVLRWNLSKDERLEDELILHAELLSSRQRDITGELMGMSATNLLSAWNQLRSSYPQAFQVRDPEKAKWHARRVSEAIQEHDFGVSSFHLKQLEQFEPESAEKLTVARQKNIATVPPNLRAKYYEDLSRTEREAFFGSMDIPSLLVWIQESRPAQKLTLLDAIGIERSHVVVSSLPTVLRTDAMRDSLERRYRARLATDVPARAPDTSPYQVDLSQYYNGLLHDSWQMTGMVSNSLFPITIGVQEMGGVLYDVRGVVQLNSTNLHAQTARRLTDSVEGIPVGVAGKQAHLLLAGAYRVPNGTEVGRVVFHYADGEAWEHPLTFGVDLADWWYNGNHQDGVELDIVWEQNVMQRQIRLFHSTIPLPEKEVPLESIDLKGGQTDCAPFVVAITLDPKD